MLDAVDLTQAETVGAEVGMNLRGFTLGLISGEQALTPELFRDFFEQALNGLSAGIQSTAPALFVPMLASMMVHMLLGKTSSGTRTVQFVCRAAAIAALAAIFAGLIDDVQALLHSLLRCSDAFTPALLAITAMSGTAVAATLSPFAAMLADLLEKVMGEWGIALSAAAAGIAIAGNLSPRIRLKRLYSLLRQTLQWGAGATMAAFMAMLSLQGRIGVGRDTAALRTARYAIESVVPIIGGSVSDSFDSLAASAMVVRNALGTSGFVVIVLYCIAPLVKIAGMSLMLKFAAAAAEPVGDETLSALFSQFSGAVEMLLITSVAAIVLCVMLIGSCMTVASAVMH